MVSVHNVMPSSNRYHFTSSFKNLDTFFFWHALFVEDNRNITASFLYINLLPFLTDRVLGIPEIKLKVILDQPVGHCEICIIYAVPPGNTNKVLYKEKKSSDSNEIMFFQNKQYMTLEVIGTENSTIQAIVFCIL